MKLIPLTQGYFAKVDDDDYDKLSHFKWFYIKGRAGRRIGTSTFFMSHFLIKKEPNTRVVHIDKDNLNNCRNNLKLLTTTELAFRIGEVKRKNKNKTSEYNGVSFSKKENKWMARIAKNRKYIVLGYFDTEIEAFYARVEAENKYKNQKIQSNI